MNPGKRGSLDRSSGQKGSENRPSPAMHDRSSGKHSPASSHSPANKCTSIPLLQNEMSRAAAGFLANFTGTAGFTPPVWQDLQYLINPLAPSFIPPIPLGLDMFPSPFLHPMPGSAPGLFPPGLPLLRPPSGASGLLHSPYAALFSNVNDVPVHLLPKPDQPGSRPRSAKKTSSLASSSSESDIPGRAGTTNMSSKHDHKLSHSSKQFWHGAAEMAKSDARKQSSGSPIVSKPKHDEVVDILSYSDCDRDSPLELTVKKSSKVSQHQVEAKRLCSSTEEVLIPEDVTSRASSELQKGISNEKLLRLSANDDVSNMSLGKASDDSLKLNEQLSCSYKAHSDKTILDSAREESREKADDQQSMHDSVGNETVDQPKAQPTAGTDYGPPQISGLTQVPRQSIALPPRKRLTRNPEELGLGVPSQSSGSDSPSSTSNFRSCWKKFAAKANHNGQPRAFASGGKPVYDCRTFFQKMAAKDVCKSGILIGKAFITGKGKGYFHRAVSRTSPRFTRSEGGTVAPPDGSTSPRVTRSQSKLKQKKSAGSPKGSPSEPPAPVRKSLRKKTANSKYETEDVVKTCNKTSAKKDTPTKGGVKSSGKCNDKESGKLSKGVDLLEIGEDGDSKKSAKPYSLRDREEKGKSRGSKASSKDGNQKPVEASLNLASVTLAETSAEVQDRKKEGADDSFDEKVIGSSSKNLEHDGKSVSSGISTCSVDVALEHEVNLSLPPKFRRAKRKTISTSQSVSSVEDERSTEGVRDVKIDLCRAVLDQDNSSYMGCCKTQSLADTILKCVDSSLDEELKGNSKVVEAHPELVEDATQGVPLINPSSVQENKPKQKQIELGAAEVITKFDLGKKAESEWLEIEKRLNAEKRTEGESRKDQEKKLEVEKTTEVKVDKPSRSTGGKKSLLYRSSLFTESEMTFAPKPETTVPTAVETCNKVESSSSLMENTTPVEKVTEVFCDKRSPADVTHAISVTDVSAEESLAWKERDLDSRVRQAAEQRTKSISEYTALWPSSSGQGVSYSGISRPHVDPAQIISKENLEIVSQPDESEAKVSSRQDTSVTKDKQASMKCPEPAVFSSVSTGHDLSYPEIRLKPDSKASVMTQASGKELISETRAIVQENDHIQSKVLFMPSDDSAPSLTTVTSSDFLAVPPIIVDQNKRNAKDLCLVTNRGAQARELTSGTDQGFSKKRLLEGSSSVRTKKLKKGESQAAGHQKKIVDEHSKQNLHQQDDGEQLKVIEQDIGKDKMVSSVKSSPLNPLHFYSKTSSLPQSLTCTAAVDSSLAVSRISVSSCSDASYSETPVVASATPQCGMTPKQSTLSVEKEKLDITTDIPSTAIDSEPPILEKTDFTYMEQFSDISDTEEDENRDPPMLEATDDCTSSNPKPCSSFALDKHILFAKIASSALQEGSTSIGSDECCGTDPSTRKILAPKCKPLAGFKTSSSAAETAIKSSTHANHMEGHLASRSSAFSSGNDLTLSSSVACSLDSLPVSKSLDSVSTTCLPKTGSRSTSDPKKISQKNVHLLGEHKKLKQMSRADTKMSGTSRERIEGRGSSGTTLSTGDLESCGIALTAVTCSTKDKTTSQLPTSTRNESNLNSMLQHCKSLSVVVQKIDGSQRHQGSVQSEIPLLRATESKEVGSEEKPDCCNSVSAVPEGKCSKAEVAHRKAEVKKAETASKKAEMMHNKAEKPEIGHKKTEQMHVDEEFDSQKEADELRPVLTASGSQSTRITGQKPCTRKRKSRNHKGAETGGDLLLEKQKLNRADMFKAEEKDLSSVYDFDKDSELMDSNIPLKSGKEFSKKISQEEGDVLQTRRPLRLKLSVPEHRPSEIEEMIPAVTGKCKLLSDKNPESISKSVKEVQRNVETVISHSENSESSEKLSTSASDVASNSSAVGHVKCRLIKVGRHQWMSVGETNTQESFHGIATDRNTSIQEESNFNESFSESKSLKESSRKPAKLSCKKGEVSLLKQSKTRRPSKSKRRKRDSLLDDLLSDKLVQSQNQTESAGAASPHSSVDQASRFSESEAPAVSAAEESSSSMSNCNPRIPDFLDTLLGYDFEGFMSDNISEAKDVDHNDYIRCAIERANLERISDSQLDEYHETLSPASTFFMPSELEMQLAKMTLFDQPANEITDFVLSPKLLKTKMASLQSNNETEVLSLQTMSHAAQVTVHNGDSSLKVDRLLTESMPNSGDGDDELTNKFGDEVMEEYVSWLSPNWNETSHDFEDPWSSINLLSPFMEIPKTWQRINT